MLRVEKWHSYDKENQWLSFDALKVVHQVTPVTWSERYSITFVDLMGGPKMNKTRVLFILFILLGNIPPIKKG